MELLSPKQIVAELDRYIICQTSAKKAVAVALRNRYRRSRLSDEVREEITPKNIIMKGPTGVGKTESARRLAKLVKAPFVKVEATKFTEVGYVGRDVESMVRDLVESAIRLVKNEKFEEVKVRANDLAREKLVNALLNKRKKDQPDADETILRENLRKDLDDHKLDEEIIEIDTYEAPKMLNMMPGMGMEINLGEMLGNALPKTRKRKRLTVAAARDMIIQEESEKLIDTDSVNTEALHRAEQEGIIFIDEIDKIAGKGGAGNGPDVSREGVQRDILPIVEGTVVSTKYGPIRTDFILFIAAGAFHISRVEDLIPELQGRFPVVVSLDSLKKEDFIQILTQTENSLVMQYGELLGVDKIKLNFTKDAIDELSSIAVLENETSENIGARRLHNLMEALLEDISFNASGDHPEIIVKIDRKYVVEHLSKIVNEYNLKKYVL